MAGRGITLVAGTGLALAALLPWGSADQSGLLTPWAAWPAAGPGTVTVALLLLVFAGTACFGALAGDQGWPRVTAAAGTAAVIVGQLAAADHSGLRAGPALALVASIALLHAAALATGLPATHRLPATAEA